MSDNKELRLLEEEHRFDKCVCLELYTKSQTSASEFNWYKQPNKQQEPLLALSISFNEETMSIGNGEIRLGIRRGELKLTLEKCKIPLRKRILGASSEISFLKEQESSITNESSQGLKGSFSGSSSGISGEISSKKINSSKEKFQVNVPQVTTTGSSQSPAWIFQAKTGDTSLKEFYKDLELGLLEISESPCYVEALFTVSNKDLYVSGVSGFWPEKISANKLAVIERLLVSAVISAKPYISRLKFIYE